MLKGILGILIFTFFFIVFLGLLAGHHVVRMIRNMRNAAKMAADQQARQYRDETARQQHQYGMHARQGANQQTAGPDRSQQPTDYAQQEPEEIRTSTSTGATIIDRRSERDNRKIFEQSEDDYVEFSEE